MPGEELAGSLAATDVVGWYNGHPAYPDLTLLLDGARAVVVGNGNVALDVARMLCTDVASAASSSPSIASCCTPTPPGRSCADYDGERPTTPPPAGPRPATPAPNCSSPPASSAGSMTAVVAGAVFVAVLMRWPLRVVGRTQSARALAVVWSRSPTRSMALGQAAR